MKALRPGDDPDLDQAIENLRSTADSLRAAKVRLHEIDAVQNERAFQRERDFVRRLRGEIASTARRIVMNPDELMLILETDSRLRKRNGRKPSYADLARALETAREADADRARDAQLAVIGAQAVAANAARASAASAAAAKRLAGATE